MLTTWEGIGHLLPSCTLEIWPIQRILLISLTFLLHDVAETTSWNVTFQPSGRRGSLVVLGLSLCQMMLQGEFWRQGSSSWMVGF
jgi:hypothetical protein